MQFSYNSQNKLWLCPRGCGPRVLSWLYILKAVAQHIAHVPKNSGLKIKS